MSARLATRVPAGRGLAWPDKAQWLAYLTFLLVFHALFIPTYFGTQYFISPARTGCRLFFEWETQIPLIPWMIWPYLSLLTAFAVPLVQMTPHEMRRLTLQSTIPLAIAAICFLLLPCRVGFPPAEVDVWHRPVFDALRAVDSPQNLVPSLHIAFSALILLGAREVAAAPLRVVYLAWLVLMACAVVLVHQHHLIDVLTGLAAAVAARAIVPLRTRSGTGAAAAEEPS